MVEIWKDIKGYERLYQISNLGRVKSLSKKVKRFNNRIQTTKEKILKSSITNFGYARVSLKGKQVLIHRLVAEAFIDKIKGLDYINHKDFNKSNNNVNNLEWTNHSLNGKHAHKFLHKWERCSGKNHHNSKGVINTENGVYYDTITEAAKSTNFKRSTLNAMLCGDNRNKTCLRYA